MEAQGRRKWNKYNGINRKVYTFFMIFLNVLPDLRAKRIYGTGISWGFAV